MSHTLLTVRDDKWAGTCGAAPSARRNTRGADSRARPSGTAASLAARFAMALLAILCGAVTTPAQEPLITFDHYHSVEEIEAYLAAVVERHGDLATLQEIGRSRGDRPILAIEINNPATGDAADKPGFYLDGNIHGGELLGGEGALHFIETLLSGYGGDPRITELVDTTAFYVVPVVNPDGRAISTETPENHRWNIRPLDEDGDGLVDEDPPEDVDGDGHILDLRVLNPRGPWKASPDDPRVMVRRGRGDRDGPFYEIVSEGIDNDGDGELNEDRVGGIDLNRNFPANWDATQFGSGPFPLSEPETWALVNYITARPNIAAVHTYHTSGGLILRFPTLADQDWGFPAADVEAYRGIAADGVRETGYANYAAEKQPIVDLMSPGHGVFNDWASKELGVFAITTEMWRSGFGEGAAARMAWNEQVLGGEGFVDWRPVEDETLLEVARALLESSGSLAPAGTAAARGQVDRVVAEIGGWKRFSVSNPPEELIAAELERNTRWVLTFVDKLPRVAILEATAQQVDGADGLFAIQASIANVGWLPTSTAHAVESLGTAQPVAVEIALTNAEMPPDVPGRSPEGLTSASQPIGVLPGARPNRPAKLNQMFWNAEVIDPARPAFADIVVRSEKGGVARQRLELIGEEGQ